MTANSLDEYIMAAKKGDIDMLKLSIDTYKKQKDKSEWTALMHATSNNQIKCVELLAPQEAQEKTKDGTTALIIASQNNFFDCIPFLHTEISIVDS